MAPNVWIVLDALGLIAFAGIVIVEEMRPKPDKHPWIKVKKRRDLDHE